MRLILDTHVLLWWMGSSSRLQPRILDSIRDAEVAFVSVISLWEVNLKRARGKLTVAGKFDERVLASGLSPLGVSWKHGVAAESLPLHHRDPFDRMLVVQANVEGLTLVTGDTMIQKYEVATLSA